MKLWIHDKDPIIPACNNPPPSTPPPATGSGTTPQSADIAYLNQTLIAPYVYYHHPDHLGSSSLTTDENRHTVNTIRYYPYGGTRAEEGVSSNPYKFTDQEEDAETDLYYYGARYYDPVIGRFISNDPLQQNIGQMMSLGEMNGYRYVLNNPVKYVDPTGEYTEVIIKHGNDNNIFDYGHTILNVNGIYIDFFPSGNKISGEGAVGFNTEYSHWTYYNNEESTGATFTKFELDLSSEQEDKIISEAYDYSTGEKDAGTYNVLWNNCTDFIVEKFLENIAGFDVGAFTDEPEELGEELYNEYKSGENSRIKNVRGGYEKDRQYHDAEVDVDENDSYSSYRSGTIERKNSAYKDKK